MLNAHDEEKLMRYRIPAVITAAAFALTLGQANAQSNSPATVTGKVTSAEEGAMEGVVVRAKKGIVTVSVVSNARGEFAFPANKLRGDGDYAVSVKATG